MSQFRVELLQALKNKQRAPRTREPGFHASMSGSCPRAVLATHMHPERKPYDFTEDTLGVFELGHMIDRWCKEAIEDGFYASDRFCIIVPKRVVTKIHKLEIVGEMDLVVLDMDSKVLHVVDFKSAGESQFSMQKKETHPKSGHGMQVACYMMSEFVADFLGVGFEVRGWVVYLSKENLAPHVCQVGSMYTEMALSYWTDINDCVANNYVPKAGAEDVMVPFESWQCGYCNMYPPFNAAIFANKTAAKNARVAMAMANQMACRTCSSESLGVPR